MLAELFDLVASRSNKPTYIIYTSDHGELLFGEHDLRGHGWFHEHVFRVPFLYLPLHTAGEDFMLEVTKVQSHFDVATLVTELMGYDAKVGDATEKTIFINGSDVHGLAGYM